MKNIDLLFLGKSGNSGGEATFVDTVDDLMSEEESINYSFQPNSNKGLVNSFLTQFDRFRWKFFFPEPESMYSEASISDYDLIHAHSNAVKFKENIDEYLTPFVMSSSASSYHYLRNALNWSDAKIKRRHRVASGLYKCIGLHDRALNIGAIDRLLVWTKYPKQYYKSIGFHEKEIDVIYPGCEDYGIKKIDHEGINILFVDKETRKGGSIAVQAFQNVREKYPQTTLHYIHPTGKSPNHSVSGIKYREYVPYTIFRKEVLPKMDILLSPTKYESYGYTLLEAQSHKIPVIVTDTPVTRDLLKRGAILQDRTVDEFTESLETLVDDSEYRTNIAARARENYEARFTISDFRQRLFNAYRRAIKNN